MYHSKEELYRICNIKPVVESYEDFFANSKHYSSRGFWILNCSARSPRAEEAVRRGDAVIEKHGKTKLCVLTKQDW